MILNKINYLSNTSEINAENDKRTCTQSVSATTQME